MRIDGCANACRGISSYIVVTEKNTTTSNTENAYPGSLDFAFCLFGLINQVYRRQDQSKTISMTILIWHINFVLPNAGEQGKE